MATKTATIPEAATATVLAEANRTATDAEQAEREARARLEAVQRELVSSDRVARFAARLEMPQAELELLRAIRNTEMAQRQAHAAREAHKATERDVMWPRYRAALERIAEALERTAEARREADAIFEHEAQRLGFLPPGWPGLNNDGIKIWRGAMGL